MAKVTAVDQLWLERLAEAEYERELRYRKAWEAYYGNFRKPLRVRTGQVDDNVLVNFCRLIADKSVAFLFGNELGFELDELADTAAEEWLQECWRVNHKMQFLQKLALNGAVCGHVFAKIVPREPYPKLVNVSPEYVRVVTSPDDMEEVVAYTIQYQARGLQGEQLTIRQTISREGDGSWMIRDQVAERYGPFITKSEVRWPWPWPPIVDAQNLPSPNEYLGIADIEPDIIALNDAINFVISNIARIIRYHAHPKTWGKGFRANQLNIAVDETIVLPSENAELHNLEMQSDLSSSIELYKRLKEALHEISRVPEVATGKVDSIGALSGVALQILYQPLLEKIRAKRETYGELLIELNRRLLEMAGFGPDNIVTIHWPELLPRDAKAERETALLDQQLGVSQDTILQRLGFDPELERQKREASSAELGEQLLTAFERGE